MTDDILDHIGEIIIENMSEVVSNTIAKVMKEEGVDKTKQEIMQVFRESIETITKTPRTPKKHSFAFGVLKNFPIFANIVKPIEQETTYSDGVLADDLVYGIIPQLSKGLEQSMEGLLGFKFSERMSGGVNTSNISRKDRKRISKMNDKYARH